MIRKVLLLLELIFSHDSLLNTQDKTILIILRYNKVLNRINRTKCNVAVLYCTNCKVTAEDMKLCTSAVD